MSDDPITDGYDEERWMRFLKATSEALGKDGPQLQICLIDSAVCIFSGIAARTSGDLNIWDPASDYDLAELEAAATKAGLLFNPKGVLEPDSPYLQLLSPGIVQVGTFEPVRQFRLGRLTVSRPPAENIIAAKLARAEAKDLQDIQFLIQHFRPDHDTIRAIIASFYLRGGGALNLDKLRRLANPPS